MSVLTRLWFSIAALLAVVNLAGCDQGSPNYQHIKALPTDQWSRYAATLPVEQRLILHKEIMERSGHNPINTISDSFGADPQESYVDIVGRLKSGDRSRFYLSVIYAINRNPSFQFCEQPDRKIVQQFLKEIETDAVSAENRPAFYNC